MSNRCSVAKTECWQLSRGSWRGVGAAKGPQRFKTIQNLCAAACCMPHLSCVFLICCFIMTYEGKTCHWARICFNVSAHLMFYAVLGVTPIARTTAREKAISLSRTGSWTLGPEQQSRGVPKCYADKGCPQGTAQARVDSQNIRRKSVFPSGWITSSYTYSTT